MKLLLTADTLGGVWTYCMELCAGLKPYGVEIALATLGRRLSKRQRAEVAALDHVRLYESDYKLCWMPDPWADVERSTRWLKALEKEVKPDILHLNDLGLGNAAWRAPMLLGAHSCVCSWWRAVKGEPAPAPEWDRYRMQVWVTCQHADLIVAPSQAMLAALEQNNGRLPESRVIYNGREFPALPATPSDAAPEKQPLFFSAGRIWDEAKNIASLARIAPRLPWPVYVAGETQTPDGTDGGNLTGVRSLGPLEPDALADWLQKASVYVMPARYEPFGLSILEAARAGCALVLGDIPSLREIWGDAARYVHPDDDEQLTRTLQELADDPVQRAQLAQQAQDRARRYSREQMAAEYWAAYRHLQEMRAAQKARPEISQHSHLLFTG